MSGAGFAVLPGGALHYSHASIRKALGLDVLKGTPTHFEDQAMACRDADPVKAATLYLAAGLVSAGLSRTLAYERAAEDLVRRPMRAVESLAGRSSLPLLTLADVDAVASELDQSALETITAAQAAAAHLDDGERVLARLCELKGQVLARLGLL